MYGFGGVILNNFTEIMALTFVALLGYWVGRMVQKRWPHQHLRPWLWFKRRD